MFVCMYACNKAPFHPAGRLLLDAALPLCSTAAARDAAGLPCQPVANHAVLGFSFSHILSHALPSRVPVGRRGAVGQMFSPQVLVLSASLDSGTHGNKKTDEETRETQSRSTTPGTLSAKPSVLTSLWTGSSSARLPLGVARRALP